MSPWPTDEIRSVPLGQLNERFRRYRLVDPGAERAVRRSLERYGQLAPIVVWQEADELVLIDGFKRLQAVSEVRTAPGKLQGQGSSGMKSWCAVYALSLLSATGCGQLRPDTPPIIVDQRTTTVSGDDSFIDMADGTRIGVDGVPSDQSMQFKLTQYRDSHGKMVVAVDTVSEPIPKLDQP